MMDAGARRLMTGFEEGDATLVHEIAAGSETALATLYDRHAPSVFRLALGIVRDRTAAEEIVQEVFLALWNRADLFNPTLGTAWSWLSAIARNRAVDHLRWTGRRVPAAPFSSVAADQPDDGATIEWLTASGVLIAAGSPEAPPEDQLTARETHETVVAAIDVLPDLERQTILLAYRDGLSQSEIAAVLGWPLGTVKTRSRRGLRRLRGALESKPRVACATCPA